MRKIITLVSIAALAGCSLSESDNQEDQGQSATPSSEEISGDAAEAVPAEPKAIVPGSTILDAAKADMGAKITGEIIAAEGGAKSNYFYFENRGKLRDIVRVRLENRSTTLRPYIKVYNSERSKLFEGYDATPGANFERAFTAEAGKGFYVEVNPYNTVGAYELSAVAQKAYDQYEANDDQLNTATLKFDTTIEASILDDRDTDWYQVTPTPVEKVTISVENLSTTLRPRIMVYSASKSRLIDRYDSTKGSWLDFTVDLTPGEDFYVQVLPYNTSGAYRLTVRPTVLANDMASALNADGQIALYGLYFDTGKIFVRPESAKTIKEIADVMKADPTLRLEVAGHTDNVGTDAANMELSQGRAESVVAALVGKHGIDASRLVAKGYGESDPVAGNDNPSNMAKNRRVVLKKL